MPDDLISKTAAAAILGVSQQSVNQIRAEGKLATAGTGGLGRTRTSTGAPMSSASAPSVESDGMDEPESCLCSEC